MSKHPINKSINYTIMGHITKNTHGFMEARLNDCIVNYNNDIYDSKVSISSVYYRFKDSNGHTFPVDMTESTYKFIADRIKFMVIKKMAKVNVNNCFAKNYKYLRIKSIVCNNTLPAQYNDMNFHIVVYNEQTRENIILPLDKKDRVTNPEKKNYQNKMQSLRVNGTYTEKRVVVDASKNITNVPAPAPAPVVEEVRTSSNLPKIEHPIQNENDEYLDDFYSRILNAKKEKEDELNFTIELYQEEIENHKKEITRIQGDIVKVQNAIKKLNGYEISINKK